MTKHRSTLKMISILVIAFVTLVASPLAAKDVPVDAIDDDVAEMVRVFNAKSELRLRDIVDPKDSRLMTKANANVRIFLARYGDQRIPRLFSFGRFISAQIDEHKSIKFEVLSTKPWRILYRDQILDGQDFAVFVKQAETASLIDTSAFFDNKKPGSARRHSLFSRLVLENANAQGADIFQAVPALAGTALYHWARQRGYMSSVLMELRSDGDWRRASKNGQVAIEQRYVKDTYAAITRDLASDVAGDALGACAPNGIYKDAGLSIQTVIKGPSAEVTVEPLKGESPRPRLVFKKNHLSEISSWSICSGPAGADPQTPCTIVNNLNGRPESRVDLLSDPAKLKEENERGLELQKAYDEVRAAERAFRLVEKFASQKLEAFAIATSANRANGTTLPEFVNLLNSKKSLDRLIDGFLDFYDREAKEIELRFFTPGSFVDWAKLKFGRPTRQDLGEAIQAAYKKKGVPISGNPICKLGKACEKFSTQVENYVNSIIAESRPFAASRDFFRSDLPPELLISEADVQKWRTKEYAGNRDFVTKQGAAFESLRKAIAKLDGAIPEGLRARATQRCANGSFQPDPKLSAIEQLPIEAGFLIDSAECRMRGAMDARLFSTRNRDSLSVDQIGARAVDRGVCCSDSGCQARLREAVIEQREEIQLNRDRGLVPRPGTLRSRPTTR